MKIIQEQQGQTSSMSSALRLSIALAFGAFIMIGANDGALGVLLPGIGAHFNVNKATLGLLFLASTFGYLISSFNNGLLTEKLGDRLSLIIGTSLFLLGAGTVSLMLPFAVTLIAFFCIGMGIASIDAGLNSYIASLPRNTSLLNYLHAFYGVGAWLGPA